MITTTTKAVMIVMSLLAFFYVIYQIRNSTLVIRDSLFWVFFSILLLLMAGFPQVVSFLSKLFGIETPSNFIYIVIIGLMIIKIYKLSISVSTLETKIKELSQSLAIHEYKTDKKNSRSRQRSKHE